MVSKPILCSRNNAIIEERAENNDYKTAELKDRIELLMEDNQSLKTDLQQSSKAELDLKKRISQLENQLAEEHTRSKKGGIEQQSLVEIKYTLDRQPVSEVRDKVFGFIDRLIDKTTAINSERLTLASIKNSEASQDLVQAVEDVQRSFQLQAELLQIYEEITPAQNAVVPNVPAEAKKKDKVNQVEALLQQNHHQQYQTLTQRRPSFKAPEPVSPREVIVEPPLIVKKTGVFAFYSLFLWFMGIVTTLTVIEYVSVTDWAVDTPAASHIVY